MRVFYFYRDDTVHDRRFMTALGKQAVDVIALRLESRVKMTDGWKPPGNVSVVTWSCGDKSFRWSYLSSFTKEMKELIRDNNPDVIHAGPIDICGYLAARSGFKPLVAMSWGYDLLVNAEKNIFSRNRIRYTLDRTAILLADCAAVSDKAGLYGFPAERIITFPWGVDLKTFRPGSGMDMRKKLGWADKIILLSTRSMEKLYGCDILVDAFIDAATIDDRLCLLMLGDGSRKNQLMQKIKSAGKNERVKFIGTIPETDITKYFQVSDVYISASHSDGSSVSLLQAMACGVAPLVSDIPGNREWVIPDHNGWLFEDGNSADLSVLMCRAARSPQLRSQYGKAARMFAQKRANWEVNSRKLGAAYKQAMHYQLGLVENSC